VTFRSGRSRTRLSRRSRRRICAQSILFSTERLGRRHASTRPRGSFRYGWSAWNRAQFPFSVVKRSAVFSWGPRRYPERIAFSECRDRGGDLGEDRFQFVVIQSPRNLRNTAVVRFGKSCSALPTQSSLSP
jgi:hypothetical protein